jgi:hypothetical protein
MIAPSEAQAEGIARFAERSEASNRNPLLLL